MQSPSEREEALFCAALGLRSRADREAFLDRVCADDAALRQRLETRLVTDNGLDRLPSPNPPAIQTPAPSGTETNPNDDQVGMKVGRYRLVEEIGVGGFGAVYRAEQEEPVRRQVALKIIKLGMDTKEVIARFEVERQALAMMDHPNIARVLDAGATASGRPYFVMELIQGERITEYCDKNNLTTRLRLELFVQICQAIQHAHQKGIVHRDLKPSNILVTSPDGETVVKVIDFGIAKAIEQRLTDKTLVTLAERLIGTPAYMSPEQASMTGQDIDTRSDIYSLGLLLYELLTGRTPFDAGLLVLNGADSVRRTICELEPVPPSTKLNSLKGDAATATASSRATPFAQLRKRLRGDLDWIVMKCLEKDRARRYETANGLAMDIKRHLANERGRKYWRWIARGSARSIPIPSPP
jgi:serine/threonine protein kinase